VTRTGRVAVLVLVAVAIALAASVIADPPLHGRPDGRVIPALLIAAATLAIVARAERRRTPGMADITLEGNLKDAPELAFTPNGHARLRMAVAEDYRRRNQSTGDWEKDGTSWWDVELWGDSATRIAELDLPKGQRVLVSGTVRIEDYERTDGGRGRSARVKARRLLPFPRTAPAPDPVPAGAPADWGRSTDEPPY
jgi:hypothetical protein